MSPILLTILSVNDSRVANSWSIGGGGEPSRDVFENWWSMLRVRGMQSRLCAASAVSLKDASKSNVGRTWDTER